MLSCERAGGGNAFDICEQQAAGGERNNPFNVAYAQRWAIQGGKTCGNMPCCRHPKSRKPKHGRSDNR